MMKYGWKRKGLSLLLTAVLLATSIPFSPFAGLTVQAAEPKNTETVTIGAGEHTLSDKTINGKRRSYCQKRRQTYPSERHRQCRAGTVGDLY